MPHQLLVALFISSFLTNLSTSFLTPPTHKHILLRKDITVNFQDPLASVYQIPNLNVIDRQDFHVLKSIFNSTNGDEWFWRSPAVDRVIVAGNGNGKNQPWDFDLIEQNMNYSIPCYDWSDTIQCNSNGKVIALSLTRMSLYGHIPTDIGLLSELQTLDLSHNQLCGSIPSEIGQLNQLKQLTLNNNILSGSIPGELGASLIQLDLLDLSSNELVGTIPASLSNLIHLQSLQLCVNHLSGLIPMELGRLVRLTSLNVASNELVGPVPEEVRMLPHLLYMNLQFNRFHTYDDDDEDDETGKQY